MRRLICLVLTTALLTSGCSKLSSYKLPWQASKPKFAVVDWQKLVKEHPKYKELIVSGESVENVMRMRDRQLAVGQHQLNLLARMQSFKTQGKQNFSRAQFAAKMGERQAIENDSLRKLEETVSAEMESQVAKDRAMIEESFRLLILNLRMKLKSIKMTQKARQEVLKELEEVLSAKANALANVEGKKQQLVNQKMQSEVQAAQARINAYAQEQQATIGNSSVKVGGTRIEPKEGREELDKLIASMDEQIRIKQEIHDKILKNINSDIESAIKKINLTKKYTLVLRDVKGNISAEDITDEVNTEVKNIVN